MSDETKIIAIQGPGDSFLDRLLDKSKSDERVATEREIADHLARMSKRLGSNRAALWLQRACNDVLSGEYRKMVK